MRRIMTTICLLSGTTAYGGLLQFDFPIDTFQEVPTPTIPAGLPTPSGFGSIMLDTIGNTITWDIDYQDLTGQIVAPGAHLHGPASPGVTAGVQVFLAGGAAAPLPQPATGNLSGSAPITDAQEAEIIAGLWYVNIHTAANGAGEIRGQVVPEPTALAMIAWGGVVAFSRRSRTARLGR
jgi:hypothetical protein